MPRPTPEAIETYMSVTGALESVAVRRLEEHDGNLSEALNSHFSNEWQDRGINPPPTGYPIYNSTGGSYQDNGGQQGVMPLLDVVRSFKPSSLLDPDYRRYLLNQIGLSQLNSPLPSSSYTGSRMGATGASYPSYPQPPELPSRPVVDGGNRSGSFVYGVPADLGRREDDIEEEMMRAAIEASKQEVIINSSRRLPVTRSSVGFDGRPIISEDEQLDRAISLSLMEAEREAEKYKHLVKAGNECSFSQGRAASSYVQQHTSDLLCRPDASQHDKDNRPSKNIEEIVEGREMFLPPEPAVDVQGAISLVVRMPDGSRHGRRFLVSDKIQSVFGFVDSGGWAKPRTYKLTHFVATLHDQVRPYPREGFNAADSSSSLGELGITNKQEVLFLEFLY